MTVLNMNIKQPIAAIAFFAFSFQAQAQTVEEGIKMYQYERFESAKKILTPLAAGSSIANYYLGLAQLSTENKSEAKSTFEHYPEDNANLSGLARIAYLNNDITEGNRITTLLASKAGKKAWEPLKLAADAITYTKGGNVQQAIDWYKDAIKRNDNNETRLALGDAYQQIHGGGGEAMNNYEKVTGRDPKNSLAFSKIGALWYAAKNYNLALENYNKAKEADPANPLPYQDLANAYFWTGKYEIARQNIEKYLSLSDKTSEDMTRYANILYLSKDYAGAIKTIQELISKGVNKPGLYGILGFSQYEMKDYANALNNVRIYITKQEADKITPFDLIEYGKILAVNNQSDSADVYFTKAINKDTSSNKSDVYRQIAEGFKAGKDYAKAAVWYDKMIKNSKDIPAIDYFWRGAMYYYSKNYQPAAKAFEEMETKFADQPSATYWRGRVAAAMDEEAKTCEASPFYQKWLEKVGPEYDKKSDLMYAYQYLALCAYNKNDKTTMNTYLDKIATIDANNSFLKQLRDAGAKPAPTKGKK